MSTASDTLGEIQGLAKALGLLDADGDVRTDWLSRPGHYLSNILAEETQRDELIAFVDDVLGGEERETDPDGLVWLPVVTHNSPHVSLYVVLDPTPDDGPDDYVSIGVGVRLETAPTVSKTSVYVPVFRAAKAGHTVPDAILIGQSDAAFIRLETEITFGTAPPLGGVGLSLRVPTTAGPAPEFALTLKGLRLPGAPAPRDLGISVNDLDGLDDAALELLLGLARAQADALGAGELSSVVGLLGLDGGGIIPSLPLDRLGSEGIRALADWFAGVMSGAAARSAWLAHLASLLGGAVSGDEVTFSLGTAQVAFGVRVSTGSGGATIVTPTLSAGVTQGDVRVRAEAELLRLDLATRAASALPGLSLFAQLGRRPDGGGTRLLAGDPRVDALRVGITLDEARRPTFLLAADGVRIASHDYPTLDLSSPGALAEAGGTVLTNVASDLLAQLGPIGNTLRLVLGLAPPPSAPAAPTLDLATFLQDPLAAVRDYWRVLLSDHPAGVVDLLTTLRDLLADNAHAAAPVTGTGTAADPWRVPLVGPVTLDVWRGGDLLEVAVGGLYVTDNLGRRCTRVETRLTVGLVRFDLAAPSAVFFSSAAATVTARARGLTSAVVDLGPFDLVADHVGVAARWTPAGGVSLNLLAPNLAVRLGGVDVPFTLPTFLPDGSVALDAAGWDTLELLLGVLASAAPVPWVQDVAAALGWTLPTTSAPARPRLRLADLAVDPVAAVRSWLFALALDDDGLVTEALAGLARVLTGSQGAFGQLEGRGDFADPYRLPLLPTGDAPQLVAWLSPDGPLPQLTQAAEPLREWRPGVGGLPPGALAQALLREAAGLPEVADLVAGRPDLAAGFAQLLSRWTGTDGRIVPPAVAPAGVNVHRLPDATAELLASRTSLTALLGAAPATVVRVAVLRAGAPLPAGSVIDLRAPGLAPEAFAPPAPVVGEWFIALAERPEARLAAGDPDGVLGQAARLERVLAPFAGLGGVVLVAESAAGHAALAAANNLSFITALVTLGTPFGPVAFNILDDQPGADAFRLLHVLLPPPDANITDDPDLATGRGMVNALAELLPLGDPGRELRPPAAPVAPRAGLAVHAVFGVLDEAAVLSGMTAIVAASLSERATARADRDPVEGARFGLRINVAPSGAGITVGGSATLDMFGVETGAGGPSVSTSRALLLNLELRRAGGWLVGGPGGGLGAGPRQTDAVRWMEVNLRVPFDGGEAAAEFVLHEPSVFGIARERWVVRPGGLAAAAAAETVTPTLPEVRVLLSLVVGQLELTGSATPQTAALLELLRGLNVVAGAGGVVHAAVDHLLYDLDAHLAEALADPARRAVISAAVNTLIANVPGVVVDLAARRITLDASGTPGASGMLSWTAHLEATAAGTLGAEVTFGTAGTTAAGGALLRLQTDPPRATLEWHKPGAPAPELIPLWPSPDAQAIGRAMALLVPAEITRAALEYLRDLDDAARPFIDVALDAVGLLGPSAGGRRGVLLPVGLLRDPVSWFRHESAFGAAAGGFSAARVVALLDALKPILGVAGNAGEWELASGVWVTADSVSGHLRLGLSVDTAGFAPIGGAQGRLSAAGAFTLTLPPGEEPRPGVSFAVGIAGAAGGRQALHAEIGDQVQLFLRPDTGADLPLYPNPPGLAQLAGAAVTRALPLVLDELAAQTGANLQGRVGEVVRAVGDGLGLRAGLTPRFDGARLQAWAVDPAASLAAALPTLSAAALTAIAGALGPALPPGTTATAADGLLTVTSGGVSLRWRPSPFEFVCEVNVSGVPVVRTTQASITLDATGLRALTAKVGPAEIDAGGVVLRPYVAAAVGQSPAGGRRVEVGLATNAARTRLVAARWNLDGVFTMLAAEGPVEHTTPERVAVALLEAVLDLVASFAVGTPAVQQLLGNGVGATDVRSILRGVVLEDAAAPAQLDANLFDPALLLGRVQRLAANLAGANPSINVGGGLSIGLGLAGSVVQLTLGVNGRIPLVEGETVVSVEADSRWIRNRPVAGLAVGILDTAGVMSFRPSLSANGIGLRIAKQSGPLLDVGLKLGSVAVHLFGVVSEDGATSGGVQLQLSDLAVAAGGAQGGNAIAGGMMRDANSGPNRLEPAFSPAIAVQKHDGGPALVTLSAGEGSGPWWLVVQRGFGPIYIEQVGFGVTVREDEIERISLLLDGRVSIFGITAAVDDLRLTFVVASDASLFDPSRWAVDLAGLAVSADLAGITLAGGLRKYGDGQNVEYVGMLLARFAVYGISVYGGYGSAVVDGERFASFFAFGAINGPIGGPPAFFLTGIGGGLGINRDLVFPADMSRFGEFPFLKALDPAATPSPDPMAELASLRAYFPIRRGQFWFAAGISFTCFALVDGIAVVAVKIGDGLEIALLGLARLALPRPQLPLVSIELGLLVRFSTKEGVLWIQAQLTDNSWLLHESVRLTGGFAFVTWFKGPNQGQFVLTMGGFYPGFNRPDYPSVPRLGFRWGYGDSVVLKGESYFALTSEAVMAGGDLTATADFGAAWAVVKFGAHGIVYFDPFRFEVQAYAHISAGVTVDLWLGEVSFSISIGASIVVRGPKFRGVATFEVGPVELSVPFGDEEQSAKVFLDWPQFLRKYLEESPSGAARVLTAITGKGALPPGTGPGGTTETGTADGSAQKPYEVLSEFELTVTTTVPTRKVSIAGVETDHPPSRTLGIAPMNVGAADTRLRLRLVEDATAADRLGLLAAHVNSQGAFPLGVWGPPQPDDDRKVPKGEVIRAVDSVRFEAKATLQDTLPGEVKYNQVETGPRKPLPFVNARAARPALLDQANQIEALLPATQGGADTFAVAKPWLAAGGHSRTALASIERERAAPPTLGSLTQGLAAAEMAPPDITSHAPQAAPPIDHRVLPPRAIAILSSPLLPERLPGRTTVSGAGVSVPRSAPPSLAQVLAEFPVAVAAKLIRLPATAARADATLIATDATPLTRAARGAVAAVAARGGFADAQARLDQLTGSLSGAGGPAQTLRAGELAVLQMPNADRDVDPDVPRPRLFVSGAARVVALAHGGAVLADEAASGQGFSIPPGTERVAVVAFGEKRGDASAGLAGWHSGQELAYVGWSSALAAACVVNAEGAAVRTTRYRFRAGWVNGAEFADEASIVSTRFTQPASTVAVIIDDPTASDAARGLSLSLEGAERATDESGRPVPPLVVVAANRSVLVYGLRPRDGGGALTVTVASQAGWHLVGVVAGRDAPEVLARRMTEQGLDALVRPLVTGRGGEVSLGWSDE